MIDRALKLSRFREMPHRVVRSTQIGRLSSRRLFVDPWQSDKRASIVLGTARSGTTKLAELLCSAYGVRLLMEPLHTLRSPISPPTFVWGEYLAPGADSDDLRAFWSDCLRGRVRDVRWIDQFNRARIVRRRVVKSIAGTNLAGWLRNEFAEVGVVYIVRHPFAVATSIAKLYRRDLNDSSSPDWDYQVSVVVDDLVQRSGLLDGPLAERADAIRSAWSAAQDPFDRSVLRWCLENAVTLTSPPPGVRVVFYEHLFANPATELTAVADHLGIKLGHKVMDDLEQPSWSDHRSVAGSDSSVEARIGDWGRDLELERKRAGLAILEIFGLDRYYGEGQLPLRTDVPGAQLRT